MEILTSVSDIICVSTCFCETSNEAERHVFVLLVPHIQHESMQMYFNKFAYLGMYLPYVQYLKRSGRV